LYRSPLGCIIKILFFPYIVGLSQLAHTNPRTHSPYPQASMSTDATKIAKLSELDKEILKVLLSPDNGIKRSSLLLAIPQTTIQRRKKRLEKDFLTSSFTLNIEKFGWRRVDLLIYTKNGKTDSVANKLLEKEEVVYVGKSIGEHTIDLRVEIIVKDNAELLDILEKVKSMDGVNDVVWSEIVQVVGRKRSIPSRIIDML
jgi:DNA-binding Lrp family transcriptional regulator